MQITEGEIRKLALQKYPEDNSLLGSCSGVKSNDKNAFERKIWIEGFKAALEFIEREK